MTYKAKGDGRHNEAFPARCGPCDDASRRAAPAREVSVPRDARHGHFASGMPFLIHSALLTPSGGFTQAAG